ncbi:hypothetical protein SETIT_8G192100v2 [Setaria italica]|uniref:Uncharacterized protein n=1 Tax=Setaria italica TaxID=4555 RepID=A0A368S9E0_SETIT|nr:hypothetical protein SETIT_8G192100v2 [Setaria italica]
MKDECEDKAFDPESYFFLFPFLFTSTALILSLLVFLTCLIPIEYEKAVRDLEPDDLARPLANLGYKSVILGKIAVKKLAEKEKDMLSQSAKMLNLEAKVARLEKENSILVSLKNELFEANAKLQRNKVLLTNTCSDLVQKVKSLEKKTPGHYRKSYEDHR